MSLLVKKKSKCGGDGNDDDDGLPPAEVALSSVCQEECLRITSSKEASSLRGESPDCLSRAGAQPQSSIKTENRDQEPAHQVMRPKKAARRSQAFSLLLKSGILQSKECPLTLNAESFEMALQKCKNSSHVLHHPQMNCLIVLCVVV